jgi:hypothetical protein
VGRAHVGRAHGALPKPLAALPAGFTMLETWTADRVPATMRRLERSVTPRDRAEVDSCSRSEPYSKSGTLVPAGPGGLTGEAAEP